MAHQKTSKMRSLGLIGGTSWHSTIEYYRNINQRVNDHFGNNTNPPLMVYTLNHALVRQFQHQSNWDGIADLLIEAAISLERAGVDMVLFCANTPHKVYDVVAEKINTPILHIADATTDAIKANHLKKVSFLGTKYTMSEQFITKRIADQGVEVFTPSHNNTITELHRIILEELTYGTINLHSKAYLIEVIQSFIPLGAEGVILGCTEFPMCIKEADLSIPIFNTAEIHAKAGVNFILQDWNN